MMQAAETFYSILQHIHDDSSYDNTQDNAINRTWDSGTLDITYYQYDNAAAKQFQCN